MDRQVVVRVGDVAARRDRRDAQRRFAAEKRHIAFLEPGKHRGIEPRRLLAHVPRPELRPPLPAPGANEDGVSRRHPDTGLLLPGFEILDIHRRARLEVRHAFQARHIHQDSTREDAVLHVDDRPLPGTALHRDVLAGREAVVHLAVQEVVAERVEVRMRVAVK